MAKSEHHKPTNFVGLYFVDEEGFETGQIIAQIGDGYYLGQFDCINLGRMKMVPFFGRRLQ